MDLLRHGAFPATIGGIRAPSTLGSFLRAFDHGNVRQLAAVHRRVLVELAARTPMLPGADAVVFIDVDSVQRRVYGGTKQGAAFGHAKIASKSLLVRGLNLLAATISPRWPRRSWPRPGCAAATPAPRGARPPWSLRRSPPPATPAPPA